MPQRSVDVSVYGASPSQMAEVVAGISSYGATQGGWRIVRRIADHPKLLDMMQASRAEGFITMFGMNVSASRVAQLGRPMVNIVRLTKLPIPRVRPDDREIGRMAAAHLFERGQRNFAYAGIDCPESDWRNEGFAQELARNGLQCVAGRWEWPQLFCTDNIDLFLRKLVCPVGVMAFNDEVGQIIVESCERQHLRVPEDVAVVCVDNDVPIAQYAATPLTSIDPGHFRIGYKAAELLDGMISGKEPPTHDLLIQPEGLVQRRSSDGLAVTDPDVREALHFIHSNSHRPICVEDVLAHLATSRTSLDRRFRNTLRRTPGDEIRRTRVFNAQRMLEESDLSQAKIAELCGFGSQQQMCRVFRDLGKSTPGAIRRQNRKRNDLPSRG